MGARQSRQSVNITTPATGKESATTSGAVVSESSGNVTETGTVAVPVATEVSGDIKNIIGETGVSSTGKIEPIPDMDILPDVNADAEIVVGTEAKSETKESSDDQVIASPAGDTSGISETIVADTSNNNNNNASEPKKKKLKKKWSLRNISFSRKDKNKPSKEDKVATIAAAEPPEKLLSNTVVTSDNESSNKNDLNESSSSNIAAETVAVAVAENEKSVVQEIIEEEETVENVSVACAVTKTATTVDAAINEEVIEAKEDKKLSPVEEKPIVATEELIVVNKDVEIVNKKVDEVAVTDETIVVNDSLNEKMTNLTINDDSNVNKNEVVMSEPIEVVVISDDDDKATAVVNGLKNGEHENNENEKKPEITSTESLPEPVIEFGSGDKKCGDITAPVNWSSVVFNGNGQMAKELNENNVDSFSNTESLPTSPIKSSLIDDSNDIVVMKNAQKQQVKEKSHDLMDFDENGLEHIVDNKITEKTNGFPSSQEIVKD